MCTVRKPSVKRLRRIWEDTNKQTRLRPWQNEVTFARPHATCEIYWNHGHFPDLEDSPNSVTHNEKQLNCTFYFHVLCNKYFSLLYSVKEQKILFPLKSIRSASYAFIFGCSFFFEKKKKCIDILQGVLMLLHQSLLC